jgi:hypothetical protein
VGYFRECTGSLSIRAGAGGHPVRGDPLQMLISIGIAPRVRPDGCGALPVLQAEPDAIHRCGGLTGKVLAARRHGRKLPAWQNSEVGAGADPAWQNSQVGAGADVKIAGMGE